MIRSRNKPPKGIVFVHWLFKEEPTRVGQHLCEVPTAARRVMHSIVFRSIIRQERGGRLRECSRCAAIGKEIGIS